MIGQLGQLYFYPPKPGMNVQYYSSLLEYLYKTRL